MLNLKYTIMKKLTSFIAMAVLGLSTAFAQTPASVKTKQAVNSTKAAVKKTEAKVEKAKTTPVVAKKSVVAPAGPTKKDGTADMRYKANKVGKPVGPTKKDGTADMRYKANKTAKKTK